jgi:hypothetical protein
MKKQHHDVLDGVSPLFLGEVWLPGGSGRTWGQSGEVGKRQRTRRQLSRAQRAALAQPLLDTVVDPAPDLGIDEKIDVATPSPRSASAGLTPPLSGSPMS